jgi:hypothetical protein
MEELKETPLIDHFGFLNRNNDSAISREEFETSTRKISSI